MKHINVETGVILEPRSSLVETNFSDSAKFKEYQAQVESVEKHLSKMNKGELLALTKVMNLEVLENATNAEIVELIKTARGE